MTATTTSPRLPTKSRGAVARIPRLQATVAAPAILVPDILKLKQSAFVLWRPLVEGPAVPKLIVGELQAGNPITLTNERAVPMTRSPVHPDLWVLPLSDCQLVDGITYHYWFEVTDTNPDRLRNQPAAARLWCTDPTAVTVDWRLRAPLLPGPYDANDQDPASVITLQNGALVATEADGGTFTAAPRAAPGTVQPNHRMVIYELPTSWAKFNVEGNAQICVGTFRDVLALVDEDAAPANFDSVRALRAGRSHLQELGVTALELLPIADSFVEREWGYATSNYFAPDFNLGFPPDYTSPAPNRDLAELVGACHERGVRFITDVVMAFGTHDPMENVNFPEFHIVPQPGSTDPDAYQSGGQGLRMDFGGKYWRYAKLLPTYDPVTGASGMYNPARQLMKAALLRWMGDFAIDGLRIDSVNNVANWDFIQEYKDLARSQWTKAGGADADFIVVGEELSVPKQLLTEGRLDGLWNEEFKRLVRCAILGQNGPNEPSFEWTVRKLIDCRLLGFSDGAQAVNYVGSHDVEGFRNERLFNFLQNNGVMLTEERINLAFACLLTAVGIPMIFAGDEFADQHDLPTTHPAKQVDPVNYERLEEPFRHRVFDYVSRLVKFRTASTALSVNDTTFLHVDFNDGKRVVVWQRGRPDTDDLVVVVANFSDFVTANPTRPQAEYVVPNWPPTPAGKKWREITQERDVPTAWVGREPIYAWEAKVYALVPL